MYDIDGNYIPGFGTPVRYINTKRKKYKKDLRKILTWSDFEQYEFVYIPDDNLPCYELRKITNETEEQTVCNKDE